MSDANYEQGDSAIQRDADLNRPFAMEIAMGWKVSHIYILVDPRTSEVRYVGKSIRPHQRLQNHMNEPPTNCHRSHWLRELRGLGLYPLLDIIETSTGEWPWQEGERYWIRRLRDAGARLVNNTDGGDGVDGLPEQTRRKMASVWKGRKHTPEAKAKLSLASRGRKASQATLRKKSASLKLVIHHEEWNAKISESNRKLTADDIATIHMELAANTSGTQQLANRFGVHRTTISKVKMGTYLTRYRTHGYSMAKEAQ